MSDWDKPDTWEKIGQTVAGLTAAAAALRKAWPAGRKKATQEDLQKLVDVVGKVVEVHRSIFQVLDSLIGGGEMTGKVATNMISVCDLLRRNIELVDAKVDKTGTEIKRFAGTVAEVLTKCGEAIHRLSAKIDAVQAEPQKVSTRRPRPKRNSKPQIKTGRE